MVENFLDNFLLGANWWSSSAGPDMWNNFNREEIEEDFSKMKQLGLNTVRIFLRWQDFQFEKDGEVFIKEENVEKVDKVLEIANKNNLKVILTLFVGWMSGVWYHPSFVNEEEDIFVNPKILKYQRLYVRYFAERYKNEENIILWDLANEQDALKCPDRDYAYLWMSYLVNELNVNGVTQYITTGIHNMEVYSKERSWFIQDSSEFSDFNVIHPYPCNKWYPEITDEPLSIKTTLFPSFLASFYSGIGKKPVIMEEFGSLGESIMDSELITPLYLRRILFSVLGNKVKGALWWCFRDFKNDIQSPYEFTLLENDGLGILDKDGKEKKFSGEFKKFSQLLQKIDFQKISFKENEVAIITSYTENVRRKIYASFILSKMAGFTPDIILPEDEFSKYKVLILPSISEFKPFKASSWERMMDFVKKGGILYFSYDETSLRYIREFFGIKVLGRKIINNMEIKSEFSGVELNFRVDSPFWSINIMADKASTIAESNGEPLITEYKYGKGKTIFVRFPVERFFMESNGKNIEKIYDYVKEVAGISTFPFRTSSFVEINNLEIEGKDIFILINHGKEEVEIEYLKNNKIKDLENEKIEKNNFILKDAKIIEII